jgi:tetratricopeptide (TPR) repeat protein
METVSKTQAALPPTVDEEPPGRVVIAMASTDPRKALAAIAQQRAAEARHRSWKRASLAALALLMVVGALIIPRFRQHGLAAAREGVAPPTAPRHSSALPLAAAPIAPAAAEQLSLPVLAVADDPSALCDTHFMAHQWRVAMESCSAAFDATPTPALAMRIAHAHWARGDAAGAGAWGQRALELGTKDADAHVLIGNSERAAGKRAEAVAAYRRYLELAPRGWHATRLRTAIRTLTPASAPTARPLR